MLKNYLMAMKICLKHNIIQVNLKDNGTNKVEKPYEDHKI